MLAWINQVVALDLFLHVCSEKTQQLLLACDTLNGSVCQVNSLTLHHPFLEIAERLPYRNAVIDEHGQYTYFELKLRAIEIALAIGHPRRVALVLERSWEFIASMIAVLMTGVVNQTCVTACTNQTVVCLHLCNK